MDMLKEEWIKAMNSGGFRDELDLLLREFAGRPTPLMYAENATKAASGAKIFIKLEGLANTGAHKINNVLGQYHSAFEHTFVWVVDADDPHLIEELALEAGLASFNTLTIVPLKNLGEEVIPRLKKVHGL